MDGKIHHYCYAVLIFVEESKQGSHKTISIFKFLLKRDSQKLIIEKQFLNFLEISHGDDFTGSCCGCLPCFESVPCLMSAKWKFISALTDLFMCFPMKIL